MDTGVKKSKGLLGTANKDKTILRVQGKKSLGKPKGLTYSE